MSATASKRATPAVTPSAGGYAYAIGLNRDNFSLLELHVWI